MSNRLLTAFVPSLKLSLLRILQTTIILTIRPYIVRELPGWGTIYSAFVGDYTRNWLWFNGPIRTIREKTTGFTMTFDLSQWSDRSTYFLGRWVELGMQLFMADMIRSGDTVVDVGANRGM